MSSKRRQEITRQTEALTLRAQECRRPDCRVEIFWLRQGPTWILICPDHMPADLTCSFLIAWELLGLSAELFTITYPGWPVPIALDQPT